MLQYLIFSQLAALIGTANAIKLERILFIFVFFVTCGTTAQVRERILLDDRDLRLLVQRIAFAIFNRPLSSPLIKF